MTTRSQRTNPTTNWSQPVNLYVDEDWNYYVDEDWNYYTDWLLTINTSRTQRPTP